MARWTPDDLPWGRLDPTLADPDHVALVKTAALVEANGRDYGAYLHQVFHDDPEFRQAATAWAEEEVQHGRALGRWAEAVDPAFDMGSALARFRDAYRVPIEVDRSVRGSRSGELVARCMVETGTSSYYTALGAATREPVLQDICRRIAADELRHYKLFHTHLKRYLGRERMGRLGRLRVALGRLRETDDDELASAWWAANGSGHPYDRQTFAATYTGRVLALYGQGHIDQVVAMTFKTVGLKPGTVLQRLATSTAWRLLRLSRRAA